MVKFKEMKLSGILSFGTKEQAISFDDINVIIGENGSGKSNFLEIFSILKSLANNTWQAKYEEDEIATFLWNKGKGKGGLQVIIHGDSLDNPLVKENMKYEIIFKRISKNGQHHVFIESEKIETTRSKFLYYKTSENIIKTRKIPDGVKFSDDAHYEYEKKKIMKDIDEKQTSILSYFRDSNITPEITAIGNAFRNLSVYKDWSMGASAPIRDFQVITTENGEQLKEDCSNLSLVINNLKMKPNIRTKIINYMARINENDTDKITDVDIQIKNGMVRAYVREGDGLIPVSKLSDGQLRMLALLCIFENPFPSGIICIDEPEIGLHADIMPVILAKTIKDMSAKTQVFITTHSNPLVKSIGDEHIIVCVKENNGTFLTKVECQPTDEAKNKAEYSHIEMNDIEEETALLEEISSEIAETEIKELLPITEKKISNQDEPHLILRTDPVALSVAQNTRRK